MLKGFKEFLLRGNVIDLAVAVVIGAAFTGIVNGLVTGIINPVIAMLFNSKDLASAGIVLRDLDGTDGDVVLSWGLVVSAVIQFILVAIVIYLALIVPMNYLQKKAFARKKAGEEKPAEQPPSELELLTEIRDLLKAQPR